MITFVWPWVFILLPVPYLVWRFAKPMEARPGGALRVPFFSALSAQNARGANVGGTRWWRLVLASFVWVLLITAVARPSQFGPGVPLPTEGRDIMMAIDLSGSMDEQDFAVDGHLTTRLGVVKDAADAFISRRAGDRVGLVLFSDRAYLQSPLTFDREVVRDLLDEAQVGLTGQKTALGDAIAIAAKRLKDRPEEGRVMVLLTDGANNAGVMDPEKAATLANELGIRIYTIGVGSGYSRDLDESTLKRIASATGGEYFRATNVEGLAQIYRAIDQLEPVEGDPVYVRPERALYYWPAGLAIVLATLIGLLVFKPNLATARIWFSGSNRQRSSVEVSSLKHRKA